MTDKYGRIYTPQWTICRMVCAAPKTWRVIYDGKEYDSYELASKMCAHKQLKTPSERYAVVEVRYYTDVE